MKNPEPIDSKVSSLSLCMIVKNEQAWLEQCLQSAKDLVDEIVVVDTGSTDSTVEIAKKYSAKIIQHEWKNNFSEARNISLAAASCDWILVLDADEVISKEDHHKIKELIKNPLKPLFSLLQINYSSESSTLGWIPNNLKCDEAKGYAGYMESSLVRLFPRSENVLFEGQIHEHVVSVDPEQNIVKTDIRIHHYGRYISAEKQKSKDDLYLKITEEKFRNNPDDAHVCYEMGAQYWCLNLLEKAKMAFERSIQIDPNYTRAWLGFAGVLHKEKLYPEAAKAFAKVMELDPEEAGPYLYLPTILCEMKQFTLAREIIRVGQSKVGDYPVFHLNEGCVLQLMGNHKDAILCFEKCLQLNSDEPLAWLNLGISQMYLGLLDKAEQSLVMAATYDRVKFEANRRLLHLYFKTHQIDKAEQSLNIAKTENANHPEILVNEIVILTEQKKWRGLSEKISELMQRDDVSRDQKRLLERCNQMIPSEELCSFGIL